MVFELAPPSSGHMLFMGGIASLLIVLGLGFAYVALSISSPKVTFANAELQVPVPVYGRTLPLDLLVVEDAEVVDLDERKELSLRLRTNGIGMPGYSVGWFRTAGGDKAFAAVTARNPVLYIPTREDYVVLISLPRAEQLLALLKG